MNLITTRGDSGKFTLAVIARPSGTSFTTGEVSPKKQAGIQSDIASVITLRIAERTDTNILVNGIGTNKGSPIVLRGSWSECPNPA